MTRKPKESKKEKKEQPEEEVTPVEQPREEAPAESARDEDLEALRERLQKKFH